MNHLYIITGASKGIGHALATQLETEGHTVLRVARTNPHNLDNLLTLDLLDPTAHQAIFDWLKTYQAEASSITLINNAGMVEPIGVVGLIDPSRINQAFTLNVTVPIQLTNQFVAQLADLDREKYVMNISSGAGRNAYTGWGVYCATKAALDHFTRVLNVEQAAAKYPVKATSIAPGVIDTEMQSTIRESSEEAFPNVENFRQLKSNNQLASPEETAANLIRFLRSEKMAAAQSLSDVRRDL